MNENVFDVFGIPTMAIPDNAILIWDGCDWKFIELPSSTLTCPEIIDCVQPALDNLWAAVNGKLECSNIAACQTIVNIVADIAALPSAILADIVYYTQTNNDGVNTTKLNGGTIEFTGLNGLGVKTNPLSKAIEVSLPNGASDGDVMVWDASQDLVVRSTIADCLCNQIATCPSITALEHMYTSLQNQINYLLGLDPNSQPVLTCSDVANCINNGSTDTASALDIFISNRQDWIDLNSDVDNAQDDISALETAVAVNLTNIDTNTSNISALQIALAANVIRTCSDVMACGGIINLGTAISNNASVIATVKGIVDGHTAAISTIQTDVLSNRNNILNLNSLYNNHEGRIIANEADILTLQGQMAGNVIRTCSDVMACQSIINLVNSVAQYDGRITAIENCCQGLNVHLGTTLISEDVINMVFNEEHFIVTESSLGVSNIRLRHAPGLGFYQDGLSIGNSVGINFIDCLHVNHDSVSGLMDISIIPELSYNIHKNILTVCGVNQKLYRPEVTNEFSSIANATILNSYVPGIVILRNTDSVILPEIPDPDTKGSSVYITNIIGSQATVTAANGAIIISSTNVIEVGQTIEYIVKETGSESTERIRVG